MRRYRGYTTDEKNLKLIKIIENLFWVLSVELLYLSQNSSIRSKNLTIYLKKCALQNGNILN